MIYFFIKKMKKKVPYLLIFLIITISFNFPTYLLGKGSDDYSAEKLLNFSKYLIQQKEYHRALIEVKRLKSYYPNYISQGKYITTLNYIKLSGKRYDDIIEEKSLFFSMNGYSSANTLFLLDSFIYRNNLLKANNIIAKRGNMKDVLFKKYFFKREFLLNVLADDLDKIDKKKYDFVKEGALYKELVSYSRNQYTLLKNPTSAIFAGIFPGGGYMYAGDSNTGITALIMISLTAILTYAAFKSDNKPIGIFVGAVGTFFYGGSIVGGYMSSLKYNNGIKENIKNNLIEELSLEEDREDIFNRYGIGKYEKK